MGRERYAAFGERRRGEAPATTDFLYTAQRFNANVGLYHYSDGIGTRRLYDYFDTQTIGYKSGNNVSVGFGRYYDPLLGRFVQPDPVTPGKTSIAYNRYAYTYNNPLRHLDPDGHCPSCFSGAYISYLAYMSTPGPKYQGDAINAIVSGFVGGGAGPFVSAFLGAKLGAAGFAVGGPVGGIAGAGIGIALGGGASNVAGYALGGMAENAWISLMGLQEKGWEWNNKTAAFEFGAGALTAGMVPRWTDFDQLWQAYGMANSIYIVRFLGYTYENGVDWMRSLEEWLSPLFWSTPTWPLIPEPNMYPMFP